MFSFSVFEKKLGPDAIGRLTACGEEAADITEEPQVEVESRLNHIDAPDLKPLSRKIEGRGVTLDISFDAE